MFDLLDSVLAFVELLHVEVTLVVGEVLALDASLDNSLILIIHAQSWYIGVKVRPLVCFSGHLFLSCA